MSKVLRLTVFLLLCSATPSVVELLGPCASLDFAATAEERATEPGLPTSLEQPEGESENDIEPYSDGVWVAVIHIVTMAPNPRLLF